LPLIIKCVFDVAWISSLLQLYIVATFYFYITFVIEI
jgi:hypothetical protein